MKHTTLVNTKLDGEQQVVWYDKEDFANRTIQIYSIEHGIETIHVPDNEILCDFCNNLITSFPVPCFRDYYALCPQCYNTQILGKEYKEGDNYIK